VPDIGKDIQPELELDNYSKRQNCGQQHQRMATSRNE